MPLGAAFVQETTVFREFGPLAGSTMRLAYDVAPKIGEHAVAADLRRRRPLLPAAGQHRRAGAARSAASRASATIPDFLYFGGNSEMRGYDYLQFVGQNVVFANAELRFPIIEAALTPIGVIGGIRGVFFANIGGGWFNDQDFKFATSERRDVQPDRRLPARRDRRASSSIRPRSCRFPSTGRDKTISGFRLKDGRASYGLGLETFVLGFPIHFDWAWRTLFNAAGKMWSSLTDGQAAGTSGSNGSASRASRSGSATTSERV